VFHPAFRIQRRSLLSKLSFLPPRSSPAARGHEICSIGHGKRSPPSKLPSPAPARFKLTPSKPTATHNPSGQAGPGRSTSWTNGPITPTILDCTYGPAQEAFPSRPMHEQNRGSNRRGFPTTSWMQFNFIPYGPEPATNDRGRAALQEIGAQGHLPATKRFRLLPQRLPRPVSDGRAVRVRRPAIVTLRAHRRRVPAGEQNPHTPRFDGPFDGYFSARAVDKTIRAAPTRFV